MELNDLLNGKETFGEWSILTAYRGSITHNTKGVNSGDIDLISVQVPSIDYYFGLKTYGSRGTFVINTFPYDVVSYELRKFMDLLAQGNPNAMETLWLKPEHYLKMTTDGRDLIDHRSLFVSRSAYKSISGYATAQYRKVLGTEGYDSKAAAHLLRLLRMGKELMDTGELNVYREDGAELMEVKCGKWTLTRLNKEVEHAFSALDAAYNASSLQERPDRELVSDLTRYLISSTFKGREEIASLDR